MLISDNAVEKKDEGESESKNERERERSSYIKTFSISICKTSFLSDCLELKPCFLNLF